MLLLDTVCLNSPPVMKKSSQVKGVVRVNQFKNSETFNCHRELYQYLYWRLQFVFQIGHQIKSMHQLSSVFDMRHI